MKVSASVFVDVCDLIACVYVTLQASLSGTLLHACVCVLVYWKLMCFCGYVWFECVCVYVTLQASLSGTLLHACVCTES